PRPCPLLHSALLPFPTRRSSDLSNGHVYFAAHRRVLRSTDGGASFHTVFGSTVAANSSNGQNDIVITDAGKVIIAMNGGNPDESDRKSTRLNSSHVKISYAVFCS